LAVGKSLLTVGYHLIPYVSGDRKIFMESPIPQSWCRAVAQILWTGDKDAIITTVQSDRDWGATFPDAWDWNRFEAVAAALETSGVTGRPIATMAEPGETWAFWFHFQGRKLYAKINLTTGGQVIIIYSTHPPRKGEDHL
jgi:hypothetical protein